jgi:hypothetical protein
MWGDHYRGSSVIESGKVTSLEERDLVEIIVDDGTLPPAVPAVSQFDVTYVLGNERFTKSVKKGTTVEQFKESTPAPYDSGKGHTSSFRSTIFHSCS